MQVGFDDFLVPGFSIGQGAAAPTLKEFRDGLNLLAFVGTGPTTEEGFFVVHILHTYKAETNITFHVHWSHIIAVPSGNVKWNIDYSLARGYGAGVYPAPTTLSSVQAADAQYTHHITDDDDMTITAGIELEPDTVILGRIYRDPADAEDTFENDAYLIHSDIHFEVGSVGSAERNRPFTSIGF